MSRWRTLGWSGLTILIFFGGAEILLRTAGVRTLLEERDPFLGFSRSVPVFEERPALGLVVTSARAERHSFNHQEFLASKPARGFRLFTLGGSSAFGFPWGAGVAFTKRLGDALQAVRPGLRIEAVNAAGLSYGSHRLRVLVHEVIRYEPDVLVIFEGHNEFVERRFYGDLLGRRVELDPIRKLLHSWRLYSAMARLGGAGPRGEEAAAGDLLGLDVNRQVGARTGEREKAEVLTVFEENLNAILDVAAAGGAAAVLCTVPSNLRDWAPNESFFGIEVDAGRRDRLLASLRRGRESLERGLASEAAAHLEEARRAAPGYAEVHFRLGRAYESLERWDDARASYRTARDADGQPARALGGVNDAIRRVASERGALLVDVERLFEEASPHGLPGMNLLEDYVHPTPRGHALIALAIYRALIEGGVLGGERAADEAAFWNVVGGSAAPAPGGVPPGAEARTPTMLFNMGVVLENQGLAEAAEEKYRACLALQPRFYAARFNLGRLLLAAGRAEEAAAELRAAAEVDSEGRRAKYLTALGLALGDLGRIEEAEAALRRAVESDPRYAPAHAELGAVLLRGGRTAEAVASLETAAAIDPDDAPALARLGEALAAAGRHEEAIVMFRRSLDVRHDSRAARIGLARALAATGRREEAARVLSDAAAGGPGDDRVRGEPERSVPPPAPPP